MSFCRIIVRGCISGSEGLSAHEHSTGKIFRETVKKYPHHIPLRRTTNGLKDGTDMLRCLMRHVISGILSAREHRTRRSFSEAVKKNLHLFPFRRTKWTEGNTV